MTIRNRTAGLLGAFTLFGVLAGCSATQDSTPVSMGQVSMGQVSGASRLTLGSGDELGAQIYVNDRIIAAREAQERDRAFANVPEPR